MLNFLLRKKFVTGSLAIKLALKATLKALLDVLAIIMLIPEVMAAEATIWREDVRIWVLGNVMHDASCPVEGD